MKNKILKEAKPTLKTFCVTFNDTCALSGEVTDFAEVMTFRYILS